MKKVISIILGTLLGVFVLSATDNQSEADDMRHYNLKEVEVRPRKEKYSKNNNPAVDFVKKVMDRRFLTDPRQTNPYYSMGQYERVTFGIRDFKPDSSGMLGFLHQYMDTSALSGQPVLNVSVKETVSDIYHRRDPQSKRKVVRLRNHHGIDDLIADSKSMQLVFDDVLRQVDLYDGDDIPVLRRRFVSPLGRQATDFYKFYLSDTIADAEKGDSLVVLSFLPHNPAMTGFNGRIYVVKDDSTMFIRRAELRLPKASNVNYVDNMVLVQEYDRAPDGSRLKSLDEMVIEASVLGAKAYASRTTANNSHSFSTPRDTTIFSDPRETIELQDLHPGRVADYRPLDIQQGGDRTEQLISHLQSKKAFYRSMQVLRALAHDNIPLFGKNAKVEYSPIFSTVSHNGLEGWRLRAGGRTTTKFSSHWFLSGYGAYGFKDHRWKYSGVVEYHFNAKDENPREFPVRSLRLSHTYDVDRLGQSYLSTGADAFFFSVTRGKNNLLTYRRLTDLSFKWETYQQFSVVASINHQRQEATPHVEFIDGHGQRFSHYQQTQAQIELRYAPGEKYYQSSNRRIAINKDAPVFRLTHTYAPSGVFGTRWGVNKTEMSIDKRWHFSAWGHMDTQLGAGHVWNQTVFPSLLIPAANISYIIQPNGTFALMNPMEFINDSYVSLHLSYWGDGILFNQIPWIKKLKIREVVGFHSIWGHLSGNNDPSKHPELLRFPTEAGTTPMGKMPYMEFNVGLDNILSFIRIDYVHRLTYRNLPGISRNGVRFGLHFNF